MFQVFLLAAALSAALLDAGAGLMPALGSPERAPLRLTAPSGAAAADERAPVEVPAPSDKAMAYYRSGNVWWIADLVLSIAVLVAPIMASLYAAYRTAGSVLARWGGRFGFTSLADIASLPLLLLLVSAFSLVVTPLQLAFTRYQEHEADRFGLEMTETNHSAGTAFVKLQEDALANPRPGLLFKLWRESHPPLGERIDFTNEYHPWRGGRPLAYGDRFKR
jgi:hypothetical protein